MVLSKVLRVVRQLPILNVSVSISGFWQGRSTVTSVPVELKGDYEMMFQNYYI